MEYLEALKIFYLTHATVQPEKKDLAIETRVENSTSLPENFSASKFPRCLLAEKNYHRRCCVVGNDVCSLWAPNTNFTFHKNNFRNSA